MRSEKRRLLALAAIVRPRHSLSERLATLNADDQARYREFRVDQMRWLISHPGDLAYVSILAEDAGPQLPSRIMVALFGEPPQITERMSLPEAADIYQTYAKGRRK